MNARTPLIVANWKMNFIVSDALKFETVFTHELKAVGDVEIALAPPFTALYSLGVTLSETPYKLAAQNLFWEDSGAFTGEVSPAFLKDVGCEYVIIGHSERRHIFGETDENVSKKIRAALRYELVPIMCVGETLPQREANKTWEVIEGQLKNGLSSIYLKDIDRFVIAYEPVWAIGTGRTATPAQAEEVHRLIREWISKACDGATAQRTRIIYGGSVKSKNSRDILGQLNVDGALVGGASLDPVEFANIIRNAPQKQ